ncbi:DUF982 domain-containing protein [Rhizobium grahamii]|uniref:DUF982 domain-containing protein n=1 Tax=Rhizobium grahamii CCGE 502 TaxID=990285 RepID=S3HL51_9HYPH|nr:DUF982 domain-containing protein [Rhizobium grahamii]EPE99552.1 hypothetical protein RGCCGE502_05195 [Rhizobium grahamii CCGE 502]
MLPPMDIRPLGIDIDVRPGGYRVLTSVQQLAQILLDRWPEDEKNDAWEAASIASMRALESRTNAEAARAAFIMAAQAAGIHVNDDADRFTPPPKREKPKKKR